MTDTFEFTLNNPLTEEQWDMISDVDFDQTDRITFHTKHGKEVEFIKVIRCKDCRNKEDCQWYYYSEDDYGYCKWAERKPPQVNPEMVREMKEYIVAEHPDFPYEEPKPQELIRCKDCIHNVANRKTDPMDITDYSGQDIVCDYFMTDGQEPDDYCSKARTKEIEKCC